MTPLRRRMTEDLILHDLSPKTSRRDIKWVADFAQYFHDSPEHLGSEHVRSFLLHLIQERKVSWNIHKEARLALQFLYRITLGREEVVEKVAHPRAPKTLPVVLSQDEMARFLDALKNPKHRAVLMTATPAGCGSPKSPGSASRTSTARAWSSTSARARPTRTAT